MSFLRSLKDKLHHHHHDDPSASSYAPPPGWEPAPEKPHADGLYADASTSDYTAAERFCASRPTEPPRLFASDTIDHIRTTGCRAWGLEPPPLDHGRQRFFGTIHNPGDGGFKEKSDSGAPGVIRVATTKACKDTSLLSDLPILAGLYDVRGKEGVYYEVTVRKMKGVIAVGTACRPYPSWRLPGWNRLSAGLHLDDFRKFFEDPDGGRDYHLSPHSSKVLPRVHPGDTIGLGYVLATGALFFTYNGQRLPDAFTGIYLPRRAHDVYADVGVDGECEFDVNFGGEGFKWVEGNEWAWRVEGHVGVLNAGLMGDDADGDALPSYGEVAR